MKNCSHENLRKQFKIFDNIKANLREDTVIFAAQQPFYHFYMRMGKSIRFK